MRFATDPASLTPEQRFHGLASLLATGLLRIRIPPLPPLTPDLHSTPEKPGNSASSELELSPQKSVTVHTS